MAKTINKQLQISCDTTKPEGVFARTGSITLQQQFGFTANSSGQVGRNLMLHHNGCLVAFLKDAINDCVFQKSLGIADFYNGADDSEFPLGEIQLMGRNDEDTIMWLTEKIYPGKSYDELKQMTLDFWLTAEDLPSPGNRVELTKEGQIKVHYTCTNYTAYERLKEKLKEVISLFHI